MKNRLYCVLGDITSLSVDAIVNAANPSLLGGGGVDGAIHRAAGPKLLEACREVRREKHPDGLPTGRAVLTPGFNLRARYVIHCVGPVYPDHSADEADYLLTSAYINCLHIAAEKGDIHSIAFPAISTGVYGFPPKQAAELITRELNRWVTENDHPQFITLCLFSPGDYRVWETALSSL